MRGKLSRGKEIEKFAKFYPIKVGHFLLGLSVYLNPNFYSAVFVTLIASGYCLSRDAYFAMFWLGTKDTNQRNESANQRGKNGQVEVGLYPVSTQRHFDVDTTLRRCQQRCYNTLKRRRVLTGYH